MIRAFVGLAAAVLLAAPPKIPEGRVRVPVWVSKPDTQFQASHFQAKLEGRDSQVLGVKTPQDDLLLLLVLDLSEDLTMAALAKDALLEQLPKLPANTRIAVLRAQDGLKVLADPSPDREAAAAAIRDVSIMGRAGLLSTVETAGEIADSVLRKTAVRVAVLYVTDSQVRNYQEDFSNPVINSSDAGDLSRKFPEALVKEKIAKLTRSLGAQQAPLFLVHLRFRSEALDQAYQNGLKELADTTAGASAFCRSSADVAAEIERMLALVTGHYSVTVAVPENVPRSFAVGITAAGETPTQWRTRFALGGK